MKAKNLNREGWGAASNETASLTAQASEAFNMLKDLIWSGKFSVFAEVKFLFVQGCLRQLWWFAMHAKDDQLEVSAVRELVDLTIL